MAAWFTQWGQMIYIIVQMLFWVAIAAAALMIALQYTRFVTYKTGKQLKKAEATVAPDASSSINVEEFVD